MAVVSVSTQNLGCALELFKKSTEQLRRIDQVVLGDPLELRASAGAGPSSSRKR